MKRLFLALAGWLLCLTLHAQSPQYLFQYWFDGDYAAHVDDSSANGVWQTEMETRHLPTGFHTMYLHFRDTSGRWSSPRAYLFYHAGDTAAGFGLEYACWFDQDYARHSSGTVGGDMLVDVTNLSEGFHTLNVMTGSGRSATLQSFLFYKIMPHADDNLSLNYLCWFDEDLDSTQSGTLTGSHLLLDVSTLSDGFHTVNLIIGTGSVNMIQSALFYKMPVQDNTDPAMTYICWFDDDYTTRTSGDIGDGHLLFDVTTLSEGFHYVNLQLGSGPAASLQSWMFYKLPDYGAFNDSAQLTWHYSIDGREQPALTVTPTNRLIHLDLDVASIQPGLHSISYYMTASNGKVSELNTAFFYCTGTGIVRYEYCVNSQASTRTVVNTQPVDTLRLITMLQLPQQPLRTTCFAFNPNGGNPVIYAKNDITFRFWTGDNRFIDRTSYYVDEQVKDTVIADTLERNTTKTIASPSGNNIHWFKLAATPGDSMFFNTNRGCAFQLYAPSGEMVLQAEGGDAIAGRGCHAWENGVYYLAVHEAGTEANTLDITYQWIYKYAVLAWDVHHVGNGGISTITFEGNGFESLDTVLLIKGNDTVQTLLINRISNTKVGIAFNFTDVDTGRYDALFIYVDETLPVAEIVKVENATPIVLSYNVSYPSTFLRGSTVTYTYTVTNTGNMTAYYVPLYTYIGSSSLNGISHIEYDGLNLPSIIAGIDMTDMSSEEVADLKVWAEEMGDEHHFFKLRAFDSISGDSIWVRSNYFLLTVAPYETKTLTLNLTSTESVDVWFTLPDTITPLMLLPIDTTPQTNPLMAKSSNWGEYAKDGYCCVKDHITCILNLVSEGLDIAELIADAAPGTPPALIINATSCIVGLAQNYHTALSKWICKEESDGGWMDFFNNAMDWESATSTAIKCVQRFIPGLSSKKLIEIAQKITDMIDNTLKYSGYSHASTNMHCIITFIKKQPNCPPVPPIGGTSRSQQPVDPNEITGFIAESGSLAVPREQLSMPYIIEFENDPEFASANATRIEVRDTLDGSKFDLSSFAATGVTVGDRQLSVDNKQQFIRTIDMRPDINTIAQVELNYDAVSGIAQWTLKSLDPMTLQEVTNPKQGLLPVNAGTNGIGTLSFTINRKDNLPDGTTIPNRASIVFDNEEAIMTPTWTNTLDLENPVSQISQVEAAADSILLHFQSSDNRSGVWRYTLYGREDSTQEWTVVSNSIEGNLYPVPADECMQYYMVTAIDSAGNREVKSAADFSIDEWVNSSSSVTACDSYTWQGNTYTKSGKYFSQTVEGNGITHVEMLQLTIGYKQHSYEEVTACNSYTWDKNGKTYNKSGIKTIKVIGEDGCETRDTIKLTLIDRYSTYEEVTACNSYTWEKNGKTYNKSGLKTIKGVAEDGCETRDTINLTLVDRWSSHDTVVSCDGTYTWDKTGQTYKKTGMKFFKGTANDGCPIRDTLYVIISQKQHSYTEVTNCGPYTWRLTGQIYNKSGMKFHKDTTPEGCPIRDTLVLTVLDSPHSYTEVENCGPYTWDKTGQTYNKSGMKFYKGTTPDGCLIRDTLKLTVTDRIHSYTEVTNCGPYTWNLTGQTYNKSGLKFNKGVTSDGCLIRDTLVLTVVDRYHSYTEVTNCGSYTWDLTGQTYNKSGLKFNKGTAPDGCPIRDTLKLTVVDRWSSHDTVVSCDGTYTWDKTGQTYKKTGMKFFKGTANDGCPIRDTLYVIISQKEHSYTEVTNCGPYTWDLTGQTYKKSGLKFNKTTNEYGCPVRDTLMLTIISCKGQEFDATEENAEFILNSQFSTLNSLKVYPNPTSGLVYIEVKSNTPSSTLNSQLTIEVLDLVGRRVAMFENTNTLDLSHLADGTYTLRITMPEGVALRKVVKR